MISEQDIVNMLQCRDEAVERAILAIYRNQTYEEQKSGETLRLNGIGFSGSDARLGTYYAKWLLKGHHLNVKHLIKARKIALKYRKQLLAIARAKNK